LQLGLAALLAGCAAPSPPTSPDRYDAIYLRANARFGNTVLWKPDAAPDRAPAATFAPLLVQEILSGEPFAVDAEPVRWVSAQTNRITIHGRLHDQLSYVWSHPSASSNAPAAQGVRVTLDGAGRPAIWEVLTDPSEAQVLFVSQSLEAAARAAFGPPLPGRRFAVECSPAQAPETVVARVIEDGPTPMGPVLYLRAGTHDVSTLICRCMPSQAETIQAQRNYRLILAPVPGMLGFPPSRLERQLRLPAQF
jgi:hypothetical protein